MRPALAALVGAAASAQAPRDVDTAVGAAVRERYAEIRRCYDLALADDGKKGGTMAVVLSAAAGGRVSSARIVENGVGDARMAECLSRTLATMTIAGMKEAAEVAVPLRFDPPKQPYVVRYEDAPARSILGGMGEARVLLDEKTVGVKSASLTVLKLQPGARVSPHMHPGATEVLHVLRGSGCIRGASGRWTALSGGVGLWVARGSAHEFVATGAEPLQLLQVYLPGGPEQFLRDASAKGGTVVLKEGERGFVGNEPSRKEFDLLVRLPHQEFGSRLLFVGEGLLSIEIDGEIIELRAGAAALLPVKQFRVISDDGVRAFSFPVPPPSEP